MTLDEYTAQRAALVASLTGEQSVSFSDGRSVTHRPVKDTQLAIQALDAEWQRQQTAVASPRIGRLYIGGEGK